MKAYNVVRFRVKPGREDDFIERNRQMSEHPMQGFLGGALVKTGERTYCFMGEWENFDAIVAALAISPGMTVAVEAVTPLTPPVVTSADVVMAPAPVLPGSSPLKLAVHGEPTRPVIALITALAVVWPLFM